MTVGCSTNQNTSARGADSWVPKESFIVFHSGCREFGNVLCVQLENVINKVIIIKWMDSVEVNIVTENCFGVAWGGNLLWNCIKYGIHGAI